MQKVKLFKTIEMECAELEQQINEWIAGSGAKIISITGNIAPQTQRIEARTSGLGGVHAASDILVIVLYEDGK